MADVEMDYSKPAWMLAKSLNDYFAGWEELAEFGFSDEEYAEFCFELFPRRDQTCQTPKEWAQACPAQRDDEDVRRRAEPRKRPLPPGTTATPLRIRVAVHLS